MPQIARQLPLQPRILPLLPCLPDRVRAALAGKPATSERLPCIALPVPVRRFVRTPEKISVPEHARLHRIVTDGAHEGPWRHEYAPHTVKIMEMFGAEHVRELWFCGVEQSGKTNTMLNCLAWAIEHLHGNIYYLMPAEKEADKITGGKLRPMLEKSPRLAGYLSERKDDTTLARIYLKNGITIFPAHANSAGSLASWPARCAFGDEVDKYPALVGKEADPITLVKKRTRTYRGRHKHFFSSTPAGKFIWREGVCKCHQVWAYRVRCPHCQELIRMDAEHLLLEPGDTVESIELDGCEYGCNSCGAIITEQQRLQAIRTGAWVAIKGGELTRPEKVGFHHRAWDCLDISLREIAAAWLKAKNGGLSAKIAWANGYEAVDYEHVQQDRQEERILRLVDPALPRATVPRETSCLLLLVDTQKHGFRYQVWACGWGDPIPVAVIDRGFVHKFAHLADLAAKTWCDADGLEHRILAGWIDSGGGTDPHRPKHSRTQAVYLFCKKHPVFHPLKGRRTQAQPWSITRLDYMPTGAGKKVPIPGGLSLYLVNVTLYKGELATALEVEAGDPGALRLHAEIGQDYAAQMCAEYQDERGYWICPGNKANHDWDISVYGFAAIDIMGMRNWQREPVVRPAAMPAPEPRRRRW